MQVAAQIAEERSEKRDEWKSLYWARLALHEAMKMSGVGRGEGISGAIGWPGPGERGKGQDPLKILAEEAELEGERVESLAACAASTHAIAEAFWMIRAGEVDEMVTGEQMEERILEDCWATTGWGRWRGDFGKSRRRLVSRLGWVVRDLWWERERAFWF